MTAFDQVETDKLVFDCVWFLNDTLLPRAICISP